MAGNPEPIDYLALIEERRQEEQNKKHQLYDTEIIPPMQDGIDYLAVSKAWEQMQPEKSIIHTREKKKNASHDPESKRKE